PAGQTASARRRTLPPRSNPAARAAVPPGTPPRRPPLPAPVPAFLPQPDTLPAPISMSPPPVPPATPWSPSACASPGIPSGRPAVPAPAAAKANPLVAFARLARLSLDSHSWLLPFLKLLFLPGTPASALLSERRVYAAASPTCESPAEVLVRRRRGHRPLWFPGLRHLPSSILHHRFCIFSRAHHAPGGRTTVVQSQKVRMHLNSFASKHFRAIAQNCEKSSSKFFLPPQVAPRPSDGVLRQLSSYPTRSPATRHQTSRSVWSAEACFRFANRPATNPTPRIPTAAPQSLVVARASRVRVPRPSRPRTASALRA